MAENISLEVGMGVLMITDDKDDLANKKGLHEGTSRDIIKAKVKQPSWPSRHHQANSGTQIAKLFLPCNQEAPIKQVMGKK